MARTIIVSADCHTGGIAAALQALLPTDTVIAAPAPDEELLQAFTSPPGKLKRYFERGKDALNRVLPGTVAGTAQANLARLLKDADVWVTSGNRHGEITGDPETARPGLTVIAVPLMVFSAFHPDLCYAKDQATDKLLTPHYNSAIAVWAYRKQIDCSDAARLFNRESYGALGYFSAWQPSVELLKWLFDVRQLDFSRFFLSVKRDGLFMHSTNHPKPQPLIMLAKMVASKLGAGGEIFDRSVAINDGLSSLAWPLYPEIADYYALPGGSYRWSFDKKTHLSGVKEYLDYLYAILSQQGIAPENLIPLYRDEAFYDRVLTPQLGVTP